MAANHAVVMSFQLLAKNEMWKRSWPGSQEPASQSSTHVRILGRLADDAPFSLLAGNGEEGIVNHISNIFFSVPSLLFQETEDQSYQRIYPDIPVRQTHIGQISKLITPREGWIPKIPSYPNQHPKILSYVWFSFCQNYILSFTLKLREITTISQPMLHSIID